MGRPEKVSPIRTCCLVLLLQGSVFGSAIYSNEVSPNDYESEDWDMYDDGAGTSEDYWSHMNDLEDDTKILAGGPGSENNIEGESLDFYNSLGSKHNPYSVTSKPNPGEKSVQLAHTGSSHILPIFSSPAQSQLHFITPPEEKTFLITSQTQSSVKDDSSKANKKKQSGDATTDMDHLSMSENQLYENRHSMEVQEKSEKQKEVLLRTSSISPLIPKSEDNVYRNNVDTIKITEGYHSTGNVGKVFYGKAINNTSSHNKETMGSSKDLSKKKNPSNGMETNPSSEVPYNMRFRLPLPYANKGNNKETLEEAGREPENINEMVSRLLQPLLNVADAVLQRRNRSKREAPDVETFLARNEEMVQEEDTPSQANHQRKSVESVTTESLNESLGVGTNVKNAAPPPQPTNPIEALQRLTRLLDRMLRELSRFQQKFTLRLIRMTERQDIDQMQQIMQDFDISPDKPIFFIAGGLKTLNGSVRLSSLANLTQLISTNESLGDGIEQAVSGLVTESPLSSQAENVSAPILAPQQEDVTPLPVELETSSSTVAAQVQAESDMVIVTKREDPNQGESNMDLITSHNDTPSNSNRRKRSTPILDDFQVFPVPGRSARTENPYDDFGEDGWIDFPEVRNYDDDVGAGYTREEGTSNNQDSGNRPMYADHDERSEIHLSKASTSAIDQSHAIPSDDLISSNSRHANRAVSIPISEPVITVEKTSLPQHLAMLSPSDTSNIAPLNDSVTTVKVQEAIRSNDQAAAVTNIVSRNRTSPSQPQAKGVLTSNSVAETILSSGMEDKNKNIVTGKGESLKTVSQFALDKSAIDSPLEGNIGSKNKATSFVDRTQPEPGILVGGNIDNAETGSPSMSSLGPSESVKIAVPTHTSEASLLSSDENNLQSKANHSVPGITTPTKEKSSIINTSLPTAKSKPVDSKAPHSLSTGADLLLKNNVGVPQAGINVKNNNPPPQLTTTERTMVPQWIKQTFSNYQVFNPLTSIENWAEKHVPGVPLLKTTVSGLLDINNNTLLNKDIHVPVSNIPIPQTTDNDVHQDIILTEAPKTPTSAISEPKLKEKTPPEIISHVGKGESGRESFSLGEKERIPLGGETVMKKVEGKVEQQDTNIGREVEKVSLNQTTSHAPTVLESSHIIGNNNATFLLDKPSPNAISIHNDVPQPVLIQDEITDKSVRNIEAFPSIGEESWRETSLDMENFGGSVHVPEKKSIDAAVSSEAGLTNLAANNIPLPGNDKLNQLEVNASLISSPVESTQELAATSEKVKIIPEIGVEADKGLIGVDKMKTPSNHAETILDKVKAVSSVKMHPTSEPTSNLISLSPAPAEVIPIEPIKAIKNQEISQTENMNEGIQDQVVKISNKPDVLPLVNGVKGGVETVPTKPVLVSKLVVSSSSPSEEAVKTVQEEIIIPTSPNPIDNAAPLQVVLNTSAPPDDKIIKISLEDKVPSRNPVVIESADPITPLASNSPAIPGALAENIIPPISPHMTETNEDIPAKITSEPVMAPIALVPYDEEPSIPILPETDLDSAFEVKPIATTPNLQIPGLRPSIPDRPSPDYVGFVSQGVDLNSMYYSPPNIPVVLLSPPVISGYSPTTILQRQQQLMDRYFSGLLYRRALH